MKLAPWAVVALALVACPSAPKTGPGHIVGVVTGPSGGPAAGASITVVPGDATGIASPGEPVTWRDRGGVRPRVVLPKSVTSALDGAPIATAKSDATGKFSVDLPAGTYHLRAQLPGSAVGSSLPVIDNVVPAIRIGPGETVEFDELLVEPIPNPMDQHDGHETY